MVKMMKTCGAALLAFVVMATASMASTVRVTVDGTVWDVSFFLGSFKANEALLRGQPWWGNQDTAYAFAAAVAGSLGTPAPPYGPVFAYGKVGTPGSNVLVVQATTGFLIGTFAGTTGHRDPLPYATATPAR